MNRRHRVKELIRILTSSETMDIVGALMTISYKPTGDPRLLPAIEQHLDNRALRVISAPNKYAEIRLVAAQALFAECKKQNIKRSIVLEDLVIPLDNSDYWDLYIQNNMQKPPNVDMMEGRIKVLEELRRLGKLPTEHVKVDV